MTSIRRHLTIGLLAACVLLLAVSGAVVWLLVRGALLRQFDASLRARAVFLQANVEEDDGALELELPLEPLAPSGEAMAPVFFQAWTGSGVTALKSESLGGLDLPRMEAPSGPVPTPQTPASDHVLSDGTPVRAVAVRFDAADDKKGLFKNITLVTAGTTRGLDSTLRVLLLVLLGTGLAALVLMVPIIRWVLGRGMQPLRVLASRTAAIGVRQLDTRLPEGDSPEELRPVVGRLNELLARLEASFERERRFSSDVAHELRTPVSELKTLAELAAQWPDQATPESFAQVGEIAEEMQEVISQLTFLSRAEAGTQPVAAEAVDLDRLIAEVVSRLAGAAAPRELTLVTRLEPVTRQTDPALFRMMVSNLVGNAVHHAPVGSTIEVVLEAGALAVRNPAPGLRPEDVPRLFERFWRKDEARSGYGHSGLGLSLVQSLGGLLGMEVIPALRPESVLEMRVVLPEATAIAGSAGREAAPLSLR